MWKSPPAATSVGSILFAHHWTQMNNEEADDKKLSSERTADAKIKRRGCGEREVTDGLAGRFHPANQKWCRLGGSAPALRWTEYPALFRDGDQAE